MYVCICNSYRESEIEQTARSGGLSCPLKVYQALGKAPCCGTCLPMAQEIIDGTRKTAATCQPMALAAE